MKQQSRRMYIWGWFGHQNSGDDVLLEMALRLLAEIDLKLQPVLLVPPSGALPHIASTALVTRPRRLFKGSLLLAHLWRILRSDALIFGGGSSMSDADSKRMSGLHFSRRCCQTAKLKGIPIVFIALGLGPFTTKEGYQLAREILDMADLVEVRDSESLHLVQSMQLSTKVYKGFDPAVLMPLIATPPLVKPHRYPSVPVTVGIALSRSPGTTLTSEERLSLTIDALAKGLRRFSMSTPIRIMAIEMCADPLSGDLKACERIVDACGTFCQVEIQQYCPDPTEMMRRFLACDAILAERLHGAIYSYALGLPFAVMPYHAKCSAFAHEIHLPEHCVFSPKITHDEVTDVLNALILEPDACRPELDVEQAKQMAERSRTAVVKTLQELFAGMKRS